MTELPSTGKANDAITQSDCRKVTTNMHTIGHGRELMLQVREAMRSSKGGESADSGMWWGQFFFFFVQVPTLPLSICVIDPARAFEGERTTL